MNFWDIDPMWLPADAQYFFGVIVVAIGGPACEYESYWDLSELTSPRPVAYHFYYNETEEREVARAVVELWNGIVSWYYDEG